MKKILNLILAVLILASCQTEKTNLRLNLEKGKTYPQVTNLKSTIKQNFMGQDINMVMSVQGNMLYTVKAVTDNGYEMDVEYNSLSLTMELPTGTVEFSSENNEKQEMLSNVLAAMKHKPFQITMTKLGKITEIKNVKQLFESAFSQFSDIPANQMAQIRSQLEKAYGRDAFKGNIEMSTAIYPENPVTIGDTWEIKTKLNGGMSAGVTSTYKYAENNADNYLITGTSKIATTDKDTYTEMGGMSAKYDLKGDMTSQIKVDKTSGWIMEAKIKQTLKGDVYIKTNPNATDDMKMAMDMKNDITFTDK